MSAKKAKRTKASQNPKAPKMQMQQQQHKAQAGSSTEGGGERWSMWEEAGSQPFAKHLLLKLALQTSHKLPPPHLSILPLSSCCLGCYPFQSFRHKIHLVCRGCRMRCCLASSSSASSSLYLACIFRQASAYL